jgi:hypothetical protein
MLCSLTNDELTFSLDDSGAFRSLRRGDREFLPPDRQHDLFTLRFRNATGVPVLVPSGGAASVSRETTSDDEGTLHTLTFAAIPVSRYFPQTVDATVTVRCRAGDANTYWRIAVDFESSALLEYLEYVEFPGLVLNDDLVGVGGASELFWPLNEGCLVEDAGQRAEHGFGYRPMEYPSGGWNGLYPGPLQMQFMAMTNPAGSLYVAAHDPAGHMKEIEWEPVEGGIRIIYKVFTGAATGPWSMPYDMVIGAFDGDWQDAAEIYRSWSDTNLVQSATRLEEREDLPEWIGDSPVVVTYGATGPGHHAGPTEPNELFPFANVIPHLDRYAEAFGTKMLNVLMQWEGTAPWSPPYVWPPLGGEEAFRDYAKGLHERGHICGLYCSGTAWTQFSSTGPGNYDRRDDFVREGLAKEMTKGPQGEMVATVCNGDSLRHGYDFCPASARGAEILAEEARKMQEAGVDYIQLFDQNLGAAPYFCYSPDHDHPRAPGAWETDAMRELIDRIQSTLDAGDTQVLLGCEAAAAETFVDRLPLNDLRYPMTFPFGRPVPAYAHVYHEYVNNFQGNQVSTAEWIDTDSSPHHVLLLTAYSFAAGDLMTIILKDGGKIHWSWCCRWEEEPPEQEPIIALIRNLTAWRKGAGRDYLHFGRMEKPLALNGVGEYAFKRKKGSRLSYPSVLTTRWSLPERPDAQFLVNYLPEEQTVTVATEPGTVVTVHRAADGSVTERIEGSGPLTLTIGPLDAVMLTFDGDGRCS